MLGLTGVLRSFVSVYDIESIESDLYLSGVSSLSVLSLLASKHELRHPDLRAGRGHR